MKSTFELIIEDARQRVPQLTAISCGLLVIALTQNMQDYGGFWAIMVNFMFLVSIAIVLLVVLLDSSKGLHYSKWALYSASIIAVLWVLSLVHALTSSDAVLISFDIGQLNSGTVLDLYIAPILVMSVVAIIGVIALAVSNRRDKRSKSIKGIKNKDLFK